MAISGKVWDFFFGWDRSRAVTASLELKQFVRIGEQMLEVERDIGHFTILEQIARSNPPTQQEAMKFSVLAEKHGISLATCDDGTPLVTGEQLHRARRDAEIFEAYGYIRGRWRIRKEMKSSK